jgi:hypothetical protein
MKVVEGQIAALIEEILVSKQVDSSGCVLRKIEGMPCFRVWACRAANDPAYGAERSIGAALRSTLLEVSVFFTDDAKNCAKYA